MSKDIKSPVLKEIDITKIVVSKTNPRQFFNNDTIKELADSISKNGILQPILVRPKGQKFELVCGERRLRASKKLKLKTIPSQIKSLTDEECLEAQIIENLEREDVHPLHEAISFKKLLERNDNNIKTIADKIAKSTTYVIQRLQLNSLIQEFKEEFFKEEINISHALIISKLSETDQKIVLEKGKNWNNDFKSAKEMKKFIEQNITNSLGNAPFDIKNDNLIENGISCVNCLKRSGSNSLLFSDVEEKDRCFDSPCYTLKTSIHTLKTVKSIIENSEDVILIKANDDISKGISKLIEDFKVPVLTRYDDFYATSSKKGKKAFWINGNSIGKFETIDVNVKSKNKAETLTIKEQIEKIEQRAKRSLELDAEKVHKKVVGALGSLKDFNTVGKLPKKDIDTFLERYLILRSASWELKQELFKTLNLKYFTGVYENHDKKIKEILSLTEKQMTYATRQIVFDSFKSHIPRYDTGYFLRKLAEEYKGVPIAEYEKEQKEIAEKRIDRQKERISKLKNPKKVKVKK